MNVLRALITVYYERRYPPAWSVYACPSCGQHFHNRDWLMPLGDTYYHATLACCWAKNPNRGRLGRNSGVVSAPYLTFMEGVPAKYAERLSKRPHIQQPVQK
jgi:hypothetical protein